MSKIKKQLLAGPYLIWIIGFIILPLFMIVYYAFKGSDGGFTFEYVAAIAQHTNIKALLLSLRLGIQKRCHQLDTHHSRTAGLQHHEYLRSSRAWHGL